MFNEDKDSNVNDNKSVANPRGASGLCLVGTTLVLGFEFQMKSRSSVVSC